MTRRAARFTVVDVSRAMKGVTDAGATVARCEITPDGRIVVVTTAGAALDAQPANDVEMTPLERWRQKRDARRKGVEPSPE